jgi:hypothetical protein
MIIGGGFIQRGEDTSSKLLNQVLLLLRFDDTEVLDVLGLLDPRTELLRRGTLAIGRIVIVLLAPRAIIFGMFLLLLLRI